MRPSSSLLLLCAITSAFAQAPVPAPYQDIYSMMDSKLTAFENTVSGRTRVTSKVPLNAPQLLMVNFNQINSFLTPGYYDVGVLTELQQVKAAGATAVTIHINFPSLTRGFHTYNGSDFNAYVAFFRRLCDDVHAMGMKLVIEGVVGVYNPIYDSSGMAGYLHTLSWDDYLAGRVENTANIASLVRPDYLSLITEPDTEAMTSGQPNLEDPAKTTQMLVAMINAARQNGDSTMKIGAGFGTWSMTNSSWLPMFLGTAIDYLDIHVYPFNKDFLPYLFTASDAARAAGKGFAMSEVWPHKVRDTELDVLDPNEAFSRDVFSFWAPIDSRFLRAIVNFSKNEESLFVSPFWTHYMYAYLDYEDYANATPAELNSASDIAAVNAYNLGVLNETGIAWRDAILAAPDRTAPDIPSNITSTVGTGGVQLAWGTSADNVGVAAYRVYRDGQLRTTTPLPNFAEVALTAGTEYAYEIEAFDASGNVSPRSSALKIRPRDPEGPSTPGTIMISNLTSTSVTLRWSPSTDNVGVVGYYLMRGTSPTSMYKFADIKVPTFTDTIVPGGAYFYAVKAYDAAGWQSGLTSVINVIPAADKEAPTVPQDARAVTNSSTSVTLSWSASTDNNRVANYRVYRESATSPLSSVGYTSATSLTDTRPAPGTTYSYYVTAVDPASNESAKSAAVQVITPADTVKPTAPSALSAIAVSTKNINLSWQPATDNYAVVRYSIYRASAGSAMAVIASSATTAYTDTRGVANTKFTYAVSALDAAGNEGPLSSVASATTPADTTAPAAPAAPQATAASMKSVILSWTATTDDTGVSAYKVYRSSTGSAATLLGSTTTLTFTDSKVTPNTTYSYSISALDASSNESAMSPARQVTTPADTIAPTAPGSLQASDITMTTLRITWTAGTDNNGVSGYKVYRGTTPASLALLVYTPSLTYTDSNRSPGTNYYYAVTTIDSSSLESMQSALQVTTLPDTIAPSIPGALFVQTGGAKTASLTWSPATDNYMVAKYRIYRGLDAATLAPISYSGSTTFTNSSLVTGRMYYYAVAAVDAAGNEGSLGSVVPFTAQ